MSIYKLPWPIAEECSGDLSDGIWKHGLNLSQKRGEKQEQMVVAVIRQNTSSGHIADLLPAGGHYAISATGRCCDRSLQSMEKLIKRFRKLKSVYMFTDDLRSANLIS